MQKSIANFWQTFTMSSIGRAVLQFVLVSKTFTLIAAQVPEIIISPRPVNSSVNGVAEFTCTAVAISIVWEANEVQLDASDEIFIGITAVNELIRMSTLRMIVSSTDNAANITCTAVSLSPASIVISDSALLLVQGWLESVNDLNLTVINSTTIFISWSPPFTLEGVPILGYNVTIVTNTTSRVQKEILSVAGNTTVMYYNYYFINNNNYFNVEVHVLPFNEAGPGESAFSAISILNSAQSQERSLNTAVLTAQRSTYSSAAIITSTANNETTAHLSTIDKITIVVFPVVAMVLILILATLMLCCLKRRHVNRKETQAAELKDVIMMNDSPAYAEVKRHTLQRLDLCENSAYGVVK